MSRRRSVPVTAADILAGSETAPSMDASQTSLKIRNCRLLPFPSRFGLRLCSFKEAPSLRSLEEHAIDPVLLLVNRQGTTTIIVQPQ